MLRLFRSGAIESGEAAVLSAYADGNLLDYRFQFAAATILRKRCLTKYRLASADAVVSFDLYGGVVLGIEMLGLSPMRASTQIDRFSEEFSDVSEIPVLGMELDGKRTSMTMDIMAITQPSALALRYATATRQFEVCFDACVRSSSFGAGSILYNADYQVAGVRLNLDAVAS